MLPQPAKGGQQFGLVRKPQQRGGAPPKILFALMLAHSAALLPSSRSEPEKRLGVPAPVARHRLVSAMSTMYGGLERPRAVQQCF